MVKKVASIGFEGRDKLVKGALYITDAVKTTIGPGGQNFAIEKGNRITNDGVTIGRELLGSLNDEAEDRGARIIVEASTKANDEVGDGSTTTFVLAGAILKDAIRQLPSQDRIVGKLSPMELIKKIEEERDFITEKLREKVEKIDSVERAIEVATVSVEDKELGEIIGRTQWELGEDGVILAEETNSRECSVERVKGLLFDNGFGTVAVVNNAEKEALELFDVHVIYTNYTISKLETIKPVIESLIKMGHRNIVVMARAFTEDAIRECLKQMEVGLNIYPLNAPYTDQAQIMLDLESVIGGRFINTETDSIDNIQVSDVGFATHVLAKRTSTIFAGKGTEKVEERIKTLEQKRDGTGSEFEKKNLTTRIAQLTNGFALLKIGAKSETERKYKKDKADDAVNAIRAALQEGVIKGGGLALKEVSAELPDTFILKNAICAPHQEIMKNAGDSFVIEPWVKDSFKITRVALEKACSVAAILATAAGSINTKQPTELETLLKK